MLTINLSTRFAGKEAVNFPVNGAELLSPEDLEFRPELNLSAPDAQQLIVRSAADAKVLLGYQILLQPEVEAAGQTDKSSTESKSSKKKNKKNKNKAASTTGTSTSTATSTSAPEENSSKSKIS